MCIKTVKFTLQDGSIRMILSSSTTSNAERTTRAYCLYLIMFRIRLYVCKAILLVSVIATLLLNLFSLLKDSSIELFSIIVALTIQNLHLFWKESNNYQTLRKLYIEEISLISWRIIFGSITQFSIRNSSRWLGIRLMSNPFNSFNDNFPN